MRHKCLLLFFSEFSPPVHILSMHLDILCKPSVTTHALWFKQLSKDNFFFLNFCFYLFIYGCIGSLFLCEGSLPPRQVGATPHRGARASHHRGLSCCGAQAPDVQAQQLWLTGLVALRHMGSSQTRARTCVPCIGRQILNHCATREAPNLKFYNWKFFQ